jgi:hypothetical protein
MTEPKTREELEAEWWESWRRSDYSWDGLKKRGIGLLEARPKDRGDPFG